MCRRDWGAGGEERGQVGWCFWVERESILSDLGIY